MRYNYLKGKIVRSLILLIALTEGSVAVSQTRDNVVSTDNAKGKQGVSGIVRDNSGNPLSGAKIVLKNTQVTAASDSSGHFSIDARPGNKLIISSRGFNSIETVIVKSGELDIRLSENYLRSADKVTLLHKSQDKNEVLQAVATVRTSQLVTTPAPSFLQALPGRLSGLYTRQRSGVQDNDNPSSVIDFRIRGQNPTILIDGIPRDFASIEPESIESISVLKDALSTAMYGQRSSGNLILVTTKRPKAGPFIMSATVQRGSQSLINLPKTVSAADYAILYNEARENDGLSPVYTAADIATYRNGSDPFGHPDNNWQKAALNKTASISRYNLNVQSGNEIAKFYVALDYQNEGGFFKTSDINSYNTNSSVDRYIIRSNVNVALNKTLNVGLNLFGRLQSTNQPGGGNSAIFTALSTVPNNAYVLYNPDGSLGGNQKYSDNILGMINNSGYTLGTARDLSADMELTQRLDKLLPGAWIKADVSYNNTVEQSVDRTKTFAVFSPTSAGGYQQLNTNGAQTNAFSFNSRRTYTYMKLSLGYDVKKGDNTFKTLLLADQQSTTVNTRLPATYTNYSGNVAYNYKQKFFAEAAASYGGFNRFEKGNRFGLFYAGGIGWDLSKESFLENIEWLNMLKPRLNFGRTGNANVIYYDYEQYYAGNGTVYYFGSSPAGTAARGYAELNLASANITWEKADKLNAGVDIAMFDSRLNLSSEYFNDTYFDMMQTRGRSSQLLGKPFPLENVGRIRYTGLENNISWQNRAGALNYFVSANISALKSRVLYEDEVFQKYSYQRSTGRPVGQLFGYISEGFYQSENEIENSPRMEGYNPVPGDLRYKDLNDDGIINNYDRTAIGTQKPLIYYGFTTGFAVKGFDLSVSFQGVSNRDILLSGDLEYEFLNSGNNQAFEHHLQRWTPQNADNASYPRLSLASNANRENSTFWIRSADYLRLQNVDLGYTLPASLTRKFRVNGIRVFGNGFNLLSFDKMDHNDPENNNSVFPLRRTFNAGINIKL